MTTKQKRRRQPQRRYSATEAAALTGLTSGRIRQLALAGEIHGDKAGGFWIFSPVEIDKIRKLRERKASRKRKHKR